MSTFQQHFKGCSRHVCCAVKFQPTKRPVHYEEVDGFLLLSVCLFVQCRTTAIPSRIIPPTECSSLPLLPQISILSAPLSKFVQIRPPSPRPPCVYFSRWTSPALEELDEVWMSDDKEARVSSSFLIDCGDLALAQIPLGSSRLDTTRSTCRARRNDPVELVVSSVSSRAVGQAWHSQNAWVRHVERVVSRRDEPSGIWAILLVSVRITGAPLFCKARSDSEKNGIEGGLVWTQLSCFLLRL